MSSDAAPILTPDELAAVLDSRRREGDVTVVLANGCFDLIHPGHVRYLQAAKNEGDLLVVALNADATVRGLKGAGRPILGVDARAEIIATLRPVDYVTVFEEPTADRLIRLLRPDVHCKGGDYSGGVPEEQTVRSVGGRVAIVGGPKEFDSSEILARLRDPSQ